SARRARQACAFGRRHGVAAAQCRGRNRSDHRSRVSVPIMSDIAWIKQRPIAHRGYHDQNKLCWENTLSAFAAAVDKNFAIECDVHLSSDGVPIILHDSDLKRLTGSEGFVWQRTAAEMQALSIGGTSDHLPTLAEMLALVAGRV